jgi:chemotaxis response regulator CheB
MQHDEPNGEPCVAKRKNPTNEQTDGIAKANQPEDDVDVAESDDSRITVVALGASAGGLEALTQFFEYVQGCVRYGDGAGHRVG